MALVLVVYDHHLVGLVLVDAQLSEHLVLLDVRGREAQCFFDVADAILLSGAQVKQDNLGGLGLGGRAPGGVLANAQHLHVIKGAGELFGGAALVDVVS